MTTIVSLPLHPHCSFKCTSPQWDSGRKHTGLTVADDGVTLTATAGGSHMCAYAQTGFTSGRHYWCVEVLDRGPSAFVMVGFSSGGTTTTASHYPGWGAADSGASVYLNNSHRYVAGRATSLLPVRADATTTLRNARCIGLLLDMDARTCTAYADGRCLGVFAGPDFIRDPPGTPYFPVVALHEIHSEVHFVQLSDATIAGCNPVCAPSALATGPPVTLHSGLTWDIRAVSADLFRVPISPAIAQHKEQTTWKVARTTQGFATGRHYFSFLVPYHGTAGNVFIGVCDTTLVDVSVGPGVSVYPGIGADTGVGLNLSNSHRYFQNTNAAMGLLPTVDRSTHFGVLLDVDRKLVAFFANGVLLGNAAVSNNALLRGHVYHPTVAIHDVGVVIAPVPVSPPLAPVLRPLPPPLPMASMLVANTALQVQFPVFDPACTCPGIALDRANQLASAAAEGNAWRNAYASTAYSSGSHYWSYRIVSRGAASNIMIGVSSGLSLPQAGHYPGANGCSGVALNISNGHRYYSNTNAAMPQAERVKQTTSVGVHLDMDLRQLWFYLDGTLMGLAAGPDVLKADAYYPVVALHDYGAAVVAEQFATSAAV